MFRAQAFLFAGLPNAIITLKEKIAAISCTGAASKEYSPITLVGMEQLARITLSLLRVPSRDIGYAADEIRNGVELVGERIPANSGCAAGKDSPVHISVRTILLTIDQGLGFHG